MPVQEASVVLLSTLLPPKRVRMKNAQPGGVRPNKTGKGLWT